MLNFKAHKSNNISIILPGFLFRISGIRQSEISFPKSA